MCKSGLYEIMAVVYAAASSSFQTPNVVQEIVKGWI